MPWTTADIPDLPAATAVVTGANSGIGYHTALELARKGAHVVLACRSAERGAAAVERLRGALPDASVELLRLDLASLDSVRAFAEAFRARHDRLDLLVNNAGLMAIPHATTPDGFEMQIGVNHFGHFALTGLLLDRLLEGAPARVVTVSSQVHHAGRLDFDDLDGHRRYHKWRAYAASKLANLLFAFELHRRLPAEAGVASVAAHPGYADTNLQGVGPRLHGSGAGERLWGVVNRLFAQRASMGALPTLHAATAPEVAGGEFVGPRGIFGGWGYPKRVRAARRAYDEGVARRLWEVSVARTGVDFSALAPFPHSRFVARRRSDVARDAFDRGREGGVAAPR